MRPKLSATTRRPAQTLLDRAGRVQFQSDFLRQVGDVSPFLQTLDSIPDGLFFLKDETSRFVWVSERIWQRFGLHESCEVVGRTDYDFAAKHLADNFLIDDQTVLRSGQPLLARVEIWFNDRDELEWGVTTKFPIFDAARRTIGLLGFIQRPGDQPSRSDAGLVVNSILNYVQGHLSRNVTVEELAKTTRFSPRQLLRTVQRETGMSVHELVMRLRIRAAADALLRERATIGGTATDFGFCDQSAFTRQFRKQTGLTPLAFVRKYRRGDGADDSRP